MITPSKGAARSMCAHVLSFSWPILRTQLCCACVYINARPRRHAQQPPSSPAGAAPPPHSHLLPSSTLVNFSRPRYAPPPTPLSHPPKKFIFDRLGQDSTWSKLYLVYVQCIQPLFLQLPKRRVTPRAPCLLTPVTHGAFLRITHGRQPEQAQYGATYFPPVLLLGSESFSPGTCKMCLPQNG